MKDILLVRIPEPLEKNNIDIRSLNFWIRKIWNITIRPCKLLVAVNSLNEIIMTVDVHKTFTYPSDGAKSSSPEKSGKLWFEGNYLDQRGKGIRIVKWPNLRRKTWFLEPKEFKEMVYKEGKEVYWVSFFTSS